jgi:thioredoxin-like negative regulator of GroEL
MAAEEEPIPLQVEVTEITSQKQRESLIANNYLVVIDNYTNWCGPCKQCAPFFAKLASIYTKTGKCAFAKEDAEKDIDGVPEPIRGVPCFHFYVNRRFMSEDTIRGADMGKVEETIKALLH